MALARQIAQSSREPPDRPQATVDGDRSRAAGRDVSARTGDARADLRGPVGHAGADRDHFHQETDAAPAVAQHVAASKCREPRSANGDALPAVIASLKTLLANELQMQESDIDENAQFVDLGLDSISGVTWIRKINEKYHTSIEATKVYSYPTLAQLSRYVKEEAEKHGTLSSPGATPAGGRAERAAASSPHATATQSAARRSPPGAAARPRDSPPARPQPVRHSPLPSSAWPANSRRPETSRSSGRTSPRAGTASPRSRARRWDVHAYYQPGEAVRGQDQQPVGRRAGRIRPVRPAVLQHLADRSGEHGSAAAPVPAGVLAQHRERRLRRARACPGASAASSSAAPPATITSCRASIN